MGFKKVKRDIDSSEPIEYRLLTDGEGATIGEALVMTSGRLTKCAATATPEFIAVRTQVLEATSVTPLPVTRVQEDITYEVGSMATVAATVKGSKVTLHTDGLQITATTTSGVFYVDDTDGVTTNSVVRGHFLR